MRPCIMHLEASAHAIPATKTVFLFPILKIPLNTFLMLLGAISRFLPTSPGRFHTEI